MGQSMLFIIPVLRAFGQPGKHNQKNGLRVLFTKEWLNLYEYNEMIPEAYYPLQKSTFKKGFVYLFIFDAHAQKGKPSSQKRERMEFPCSSCFKWNNPNWTLSETQYIDFSFTWNITRQSFYFYEILISICLDWWNRHFKHPIVLVFLYCSKILAENLFHVCRKTVHISLVNTWIN